MADDQPPGLFGNDPDLPSGSAPRTQPVSGVARVRLPNRRQLELRPSDLDSLLPEGQPSGSIGRGWSGRGASGPT